MFNSGQKILIGVMFGPTAVTTYQLGYSVTSKVHSLVAAATEVMFPVASAPDKSAIAQIYARVLVSIVGLTTVMLGVLVVFSDQILTLWVGEAVAKDVVPLIAPLAVAFLFVSASALPFYVMNGFGRPIVSVVLSISNIVLFLIFIAFSAAFSGGLLAFAICYAIANVITGTGYQAFCIRMIWEQSSVGLGRPRVDLATRANLTESENRGRLPLESVN
jgi:O-antigen/teichoic acid export membrane protein